MREVTVVSGPEIGPNQIQTQSNALAIPIQDVFEVKTMKAEVDEDDNSVIQKVRMIVWTLRYVYILDWRRE